MKKEVEEKINVLDPKFRKQIEKILENVNVSVSMLYESATKDEKTGVYNHNFFKTILEMEFEKAKRGQQKLCLFILDIDFFKKINDTYGHMKADEMLKQLAEILKKSTRKSDIVARFGGEEFVILFPETELKKAKEVTSRIRNNVKSDSFLKKFNLTISGGLTEFIEKDTIDSFKRRADKALYVAKDSGRDLLVAIGLKEEGSFDIKEKEPELPFIKKLPSKKKLEELKNIF